LTSALLSLRGAAALRRLLLHKPDQQSMLYLPQLTQLTSVSIWGDGAFLLSIKGSRFNDDHVRCPLSGMTNLVSLLLNVVSLIAHDGSPVLPPNPTSLHLEWCWGRTVGDWPEQIVQCQQLKELHLKGTGDDIHSNPSVLIQEFAKHLPGLVGLQLTRPEGSERGGPRRLADAIAHMRQRAGRFWHGTEEEWTPVWPLGRAGWRSVPEAYIVVPPPNMGALSSLQHLRLTDWALVASSERYWRALGGCSSLRSLFELHTTVAPPAGVTFPHLTELDVTTSTSPGDTLALLGAFPALRELELTVAPTGAAAEVGVMPAGTVHGTRKLLLHMLVRSLHLVHCCCQHQADCGRMHRAKACKGHILCLQ
jgi:hypothetical protein